MKLLVLFLQIFLLIKSHGRSEEVLTPLPDTSPSIAIGSDDFLIARPLMPTIIATCVSVTLVIIALSLSVTVICYFKHTEVGSESGDGTVSISSFEIWLPDNDPVESLPVPTNTGHPPELDSLRENRFGRDPVKSHHAC